MINKIRDIIARAQGVKDHLESERERLSLDIEKIKNELLEIEKAQAFIQKVASDTQSKLKFHIEDIVNLALDSVFPNEYEFKVDFVPMRGKTEAHIVFTDKRSGREIDPMISNGGGAVDLACFALRLACHTLERDKDDIIILDEPFKFLSKDLRMRAGLLMIELSHKLNLQIILVTHISEFIDIADKVITVIKNNGISQIIEG